MPYDIIKIRRDSYANWASVDPTLSLGEISYDLTNHEIRVGDGSTAWTSLPVIGSGTVADGDKGDVVVTGSGTTWSLDSTLMAYINQKMDEGALDGGDAATSQQVMQIRRDTTSGWLASGVILNAGEASYDTVTNEIRVGDGINTWDNLDPIGVFKAGSISLQQIGDVDYPVEAPQTGQVLTWDNGLGVWLNLDIPAQTFQLGDLTDVTITAPANTEVLQFNGTTWVNAPAPGGGGSGVTAGVKNQITVIDPDNDWTITTNTIEPIAWDVVDNYILDIRNQPFGLAGLTSDGLLQNSTLATNEPTANTVLMGNNTWGLPTLGQANLSVAEPTLSSHVATKNYVDGVAGLTFETVHDMMDGPNGLATLNADSLLPLTTLDDGGASSGQALVFSGTAWTPTTIGTSLAGLDDVTFTSLSTNDFMIKSSTDWVNIPGTALSNYHSHTIAQTTIPGAQQVSGRLIWWNNDTTQLRTVTLNGAGIASASHDNTANTFTITVPASHPHAYTDLTQGSATTGQVLQWNGSAWAPATGGGGGATVIDDLTDVTITSVASNNVLQYNGTAWVNRSLSTAGIQPLDATLTALAGVTTSADTVIYATGSDTFSTTPLTSTARSLLDDTSTTSMRSTLGLGTMAVQDGSNVAITGGIIQGASVITGVYTSPVNEAILHTARKSTAGTITKGQVVRIVGSSGSHLTVELADATDEATSKTTFGIAAESITNTTSGYVITNGELNGLSNVPVSGGPENFVDGATLWLSETAGTFTQTRPTQPAHGVLVGHVIAANNGSSGRIHVYVNNGHELDEIHDVLIGTKADKDLLAWDNAAGVWKNMTKATAGVQALDATLTGLAGVTTAADKLIYATGVDTFATTDLTSTARTLLDDTSTTAMRTTLGLGSLATLSTITNSNITNGTIDTATKIAPPGTGNAFYMGDAVDGLVWNTVVLGSEFIQSSGILSIPAGGVNTSKLAASGATSGKFLKYSTSWGPADVTASDIASGTIATARLGSGTASSTAYLAGDQTWKTLNLDSLSDVVITAAASNNVLQYNGTNWVNLSLASAGIAAASHTHAAADITSGTIATARLGSGTADTTTFLRGDGSWQSVSGSGMTFQQSVRIAALAL